jgi:O-antigen/teichoic acid export membrane protein
MTNANEGGLDREKARKTVTWGLGLAAVTKGGNILVSLVLARLLAPEIFGQYGTVNSILLIALAFSMGRYVENIFHTDAPTHEEYFRHLSFGLLLHAALFVIANLVALGLRWHPTLGQIATPLHIVSVAILLNVPRIYYTVHLRRLLAYRQLRTLQIISFLCASTVSVLFAWLGFGIYALLLPNIIVPIPYIVSFLLTDRQLIGWNLGWKEYRAPFQFGLTRTVGVAIENGHGLVESLLFSTLAGFTALGLLTRARGLAQLATSWVSDQVVGILYPALAPLPQKTRESRRIAGLMLRIAVWSTAPVATTIAMNETATIHLLYGNQWDAVIPIVRPMLLATSAACVFSIISMVLLTGLGPMRQLWFTIVVFGLSAIGMAVVLPYDWHLYVIYLAVTNALLMVAALAYLSRLGLFDLGDTIRAFTPTLILVCLGLLVSELTSFKTLARDHPYIALFSTAGLTSLLFLMLARAVDAKALATLCGLLPVGAHFQRLLFLPTSQFKAPA